MTKFFFPVADEVLDYLSQKDAKLGRVIRSIGRVKRVVIPDLFTALMHSITGQQLSGKAQESIWKRVLELCQVGEDGVVKACMISSLSDESLRATGLSSRKVLYMKNAAERVLSGEFRLDELAHLDDAECIRRLVQLPGVGQWTAEMLLIFSLGRPDVLSAGDLGIQRGLRMLYQKREISSQYFERVRRRYSPHASVAGLYLWEISGGACPELSDPKRGNEA